MKRKKTSAKQRSQKIVTLAVFYLGMASLGFFMRVQWVGYAIIAVYAAIALKKRLPARFSFVTALILLGLVIVAIVSGTWPVAQNFAAYSFTLFTFATLQMIIELKSELQRKE